MLEILNEPAQIAEQMVAGEFRSSYTRLNFRGAKFRRGMNCRAAYRL